ncbi:glycerate kinase, partial [Oceanospirillum sp. HFRX-1_2]
MKFLIAPDSFKESMSARQVCQTIDNVIKTELPHAETLLLPIADGGEGTLSVLVQALDGKTETIKVTGPFLSQPRVKARIGMLDEKTAVIEMAQAAGLELVAVEMRNPELTTTFGVGEMISAALDRGIRRFFI